jgi:hypothetical protein
LPTEHDVTFRRADARRNHERVCAAALEVFQESGLHGTGTGLRITRSERSRTKTSIGMSAKRYAIRGAS